MRGERPRDGHVEASVTRLVLPAEASVLQSRCELHTPLKPEIYHADVSVHSIWTGGMPKCFRCRLPDALLEHNGRAASKAYTAPVNIAPAVAAAPFSQLAGRTDTINLKFTEAFH